MNRERNLRCERAIGMQKMNFGGIYSIFLLIWDYIVLSTILAQQIPFVWISRNASYYFASEKLDSKDHVEVAFVYTTYLMPI